MPIEFYLLPPAYEVRWEVMFSQASVCLSAWGGGTPSPSHSISTGPMSFLQGVPQWLVPGPFWEGYPSPRQGVPQSYHGVPPSRGWYPLARSEWSTPARDGVPPSQVRMGYPAQPGQDRVPPPPAQDRTAEEYLLHGRQYSSCVHTGGLSCF